MKTSIVASVLIVGLALVIVFFLNRKWSNESAGLAQWVTFVVLCLTAYFAWQIGNTQNEINESLRKIEDSVEVFAYMSGPPNPNRQLKLFNVGKIQLYITGYNINNGGEVEVKNALLPAGQQQNAWYSVLLPSVGIGEEVFIALKLEDQLNRRWESPIKLKYLGSDLWETAVLRIKRIGGETD